MTPDRRTSIELSTQAHAASARAGTCIGEVVERDVPLPDFEALAEVALELLARVGVSMAAPARAGAEVHLVDVDTAATALGSSKWTLYRLASKGRIPSVRIGRRLMFELDAVIAALRVPARIEASPVQPSTAAPVGCRQRTSVEERRAGGGGPTSHPNRKNADDHEARLRAAVDATKALGR
jgi:excisionase family DNA binding protein